MCPTFEHPANGDCACNHAMHAAEDAGYHEIATGGGCSAWMKQFATGHILITDMDAQAPYDLDVDVIVAFYCDGKDAHENIPALDNEWTLEEAIAQVDAIVAAID